MKRLMIVSLCALLLACSSNNSNCVKAPETPKPQPTAEPTVEPEPEEIIWQPYNEGTKQMLEDTQMCAMFYFGTTVESLNTGSDKMIQTFEDSSVIRVVNDAFVAVRFPVDECLESIQCSKGLSEELDIKVFPTTVLAFTGEDSITLMGEGYMNVEQFISFLLTNQEQYVECTSIKKGTND